MSVHVGLLAIAAGCVGGPIGLGDIPAPRVERFEGVLGVGVPADLFGGAFGDPPTGFRFPSGLLLVSPDPNVASLLVGDFRVGDAVYGLGSNGVIATSADIRSGTAYACAGKETGGTFRFRFPASTRAWGVFVSSQNASAITLRTLDADGHVLDAHRFERTERVPLDDRTFLGLGFAGEGAIAEIETTRFVAFDDLIWAGGGCPGDLDGDGDADAADFFAYLDAFASVNLGVCDLDGDQDCDAEDFFGFLDAFAGGC